MGIGVSRFREFLEFFDKEVDWEVLILQEFSGAQNISDFMKISAHLVIFVAPFVGCRANGLAINQKMRHCVIPESEVFKPRAIVVCIHWVFWNIKIVAHGMYQRLMSQTTCSREQERKRSKSSSVVYTQYSEAKVQKWQTSRHCYSKNSDAVLSSQPQMLGHPQV